MLCVLGSSPRSSSVHIAPMISVGVDVPEGSCDPSAFALCDALLRSESKIEKKIEPCAKVATLCR